MSHKTMPQAVNKSRAKEAQLRREYGEAEAAYLAARRVTAKVFEALTEQLPVSDAKPSHTLTNHPVYLAASNTALRAWRSAEYRAGDKLAAIIADERKRGEDS